MSVCRPAGLANRQRIAIIHYTAPPAIGGVETLIDAQIRVLLAGGHRVRLVVGSGEAPPAAELEIIPELDPFSGMNADEYTIRERLDGALAGCDQCWVHNMLTVNLNGPASAALARLMHGRPDMRWVVWCEDASALSAFETAKPVSLPPGTEIVTISDTRRQQLTELLGLESARIAVIRPPLDIARWLGLGSEILRLLESTDALSADAFLFVPSKILPHKNLERLHGIANALNTLVGRALILVSGAPSPHEQIRSAGILERLHRQQANTGNPGGVMIAADILGEPPSRRTMRELMTVADAVLLPSLEEGFGYPIFEAAGVRAPLVCTDIAVFRETAGAAASYFNPTAGDEEIAAIIFGALNTPQAALRRRALASDDTFEREILALATRDRSGPQHWECVEKSLDEA